MSSSLFRNHLTTIVEGRTNTSRPNSETQESLQNHDASPTPPPIPPRSTYRGHPSRILNRPRQKRANYGPPTLEPNEKAPPSYRSIFGGGAGGSTKGSSRASNSDFAPEPTFLERQKLRGGWKRIALLLLVLVLLIIGLAVGLGVGLSQRRTSTAGTSTAGKSAHSVGSKENQVFPVGTWSIPTYLTNTTTGCTSNSLTWNCAPYNDYTPSSPQASFTTFDWAINSTSSPPSNDSLTVSSTSNPFYLTFKPSKLTLMDAGTPSERFAFNFSLPRSVIPRGSISADGATTLCYFNDTVISGSLYTRKAADLLASSSSSSSSLGISGQQTQKQWPAAAYITQSADGGSGVPDCYPASNGMVSGPRITQGLQPVSESRQCMCVYENAGGLT
ncbi:MAG: hypothetical protein M1828_006519 [Chrysothrix sp. TS-e1954]|nr:MAG: hypothetical protein M1828_006519 [Chrysothrix sp. TS-e1954]